MRSLSVREEGIPFLFDFGHIEVRLMTRNAVASCSELWILLKVIIVILVGFCLHCWANGPIRVLQHIIKAATSYKDLDMFTETISPLTTALISFTKFSTLVIGNKKLRKLQEQINVYWRNLKVKEEIEIMEKYANEGKLYATLYMLYLYASGASFFLVVFQPRILDIIAPLNESRPLKTIYPADYVFIDQEKYFALITCQMMSCGATVMTIVIAADTMFIIYVQYICGMFAVIGHRLENTLYNQNTTDVASANYQKIYDHYIVECVLIHRQALKLVDIMQSSFSISYFVQLGLSVLCLSVTLVQIVVLLGNLEIVRYILFAIGQLFHLFCTSFQGQRLLDHSLGTSDKIYCGKWYDMPTGTQKILLFMLKKTSIPCYLKAGKFFIFSMESFSMVIQSCMSYFMMLTSFR